MTAANPEIQFMDIGSEMLNYFESNLGRIEILGSSNKIERIYFNIQSSSLDQWEAPQIRESKRQFIFDVVVDDGGEKGKMEEFVNFCEVSYSLVCGFMSNPISIKLARKTFTSWNQCII